MIPPTIPGIEIERLIGMGTGGAVWLGRQQSLDRPCAVKQISVRAGAAARERSREEARILAALRHRNIVALYDYVDAGDDVYIVMEYLGAGALDQHLPGMPPAAAASALRDIAAALDAAHAAGVVHRDLKPSNVLRSAQGWCVGDFGLALLRDRDAGGEVVGTPAYMSPEQARAQPAGPAADIYAFGVIAYRLLLGRLPFSNADARLTVLAQATQPPPPPSSLVPGFPRDAERILLRCLDKRPERRPQRALLVVETLQRAWPDAPAQTITPQPEAGAEDQTIAPALAAPAIAPQQPAPAVRRHRTLVSIAVAVLLLGALAGLAQRRLLTPALHVDGVTVTVAAPLVPCGAELQAGGVIALSGGAGSLTYQWLHPDGSTGSPTTVQVEDGVRQLDVTLRYTFAGGASSSGSVGLSVLQPQQVSAAPVAVRQRCP